jgi:hypothetical protein
MNSAGRDGAAPASSIRVDFVGLPGVPSARAKLRAGCWVAPTDDGRGDVALLELDRPHGLGAPLRRLSASWDREVHTYGFPPNIKDGVWAKTMLSGNGGPGAEWVQMDLRYPGQRVSRGFSGAAVVDHETGYVIGMVVSEYTDDRVGLSWMLPVETIIRYLPLVSDWVAGEMAVHTVLARRSHAPASDFGVARQVTNWLRQPEPGSVMIVATGDDGSAASAELSRAVVLADREQRPVSAKEIGAATPKEAVPPPGSVDLAFDASGMTVADVSRRIADRIGIPVAEPADVTSWVRADTLPITLVVDGVDNAVQPDALVSEVFTPLVARGARLLLGFRRASSPSLSMARSLKADRLGPVPEPGAVKLGLDRLDGLVRDVKEREGRLWREHESAAGSTAIGSWLGLARDLMSAHPEAIRHALLLTDGKNEGETRAQLDLVLQSCAGRFYCDARGIGEGYDPKELRHIVAILRGEADAVREDEELTADFQKIMAAAINRLVPDLRIRIEPAPFARVRFVKQRHPTDRDLTPQDGADLGERMLDFSTGSWGEDIREYHVSLAVDHEDCPLDEDLQAARVALTIVRPGSVEVEPCGGRSPIVVHWTDEPALSTQLDASFAHYSRHAELNQAVADGCDAYEAGRRADAELHWGRAVQLATELDNDEILDRLTRMVDVIDASEGWVRIKADAQYRDFLILRMIEDSTSRPPDDPHASDPKPVGPDITCWECGRISPGDAVFCEQCGGRLRNQDSGTRLLTGLRRDRGLRFGAQRRLVGWDVGEVAAATDDEDGARGLARGTAASDGCCRRVVDTGVHPGSSNRPGGPHAGRSGHPRGVQRARIPCSS